MAAYISVDAGGTKCQAIMYDENLKLLGEGTSGGVNTNTTTLEDCRRNVGECLDQLMREYTPSHIDKVFVVFVGPREVLFEQLKERTTVGEFVGLNEGQAGLLAGSIKRSGLVALSGTGSDTFRVTEDGRRGFVGGWGPVLGDFGSGTWIGQQAVRAIVRAIEKWDSPTIMEQMIMEEWGLERGWDMVPIVYGAPSPFRKVASLTRMVGRAAHQGDEVALGLVKTAGEYLGKQTVALINNFEIPREEWDLTCCGGTWKTHPSMLAACRDYLETAGYGMPVKPSWFDPIVAGAASLLLDRGTGQLEAKKIMEAEFGNYVINWED